METCSLLFTPLGPTCLLLLVANNWWLKGHAPAWLSGKLSDFAGVALMAMWLTAMLNLLFDSRTGAARAGALLAAIYLAFIKTTVLGAEWHASLVNGLYHVAGIDAHFSLVRDPTDLSAVLLLIPLFACERRLSHQGPRGRAARHGLP